MLRRVWCTRICIRRVLLSMEGGLVKDALSDERDDSRLLISAGMVSVVIGGYLNVDVL